ncbi:conserved hypothetical protein [Neospora caninum Liverpool]|uniref:Uncharacterized protein n=1 Tax=Neospora caninum (strain Liverpool) TaxID=572307 RepID=F0VC34_NEOCL|nr:conserved hypothetical protein [Neospora caninum Liverpool]CBZ51168.1 conserved hypothetical protein [Neospora caninum Liverpool]CEL68479.1 TPA: hypothetical protein BN1204_042350 [Neospora caninum Liverpool]|eukprot:XP_003881201.1 conserved hypothetical protein [Neospora caninum Liverpool]
MEEPAFEPSGVLGSRFVADAEAHEDVGPSLLLAPGQEVSEKAKAGEALRPGRIYNLHTLRERMIGLNLPEEANVKSRGRLPPTVVPLTHDVLAGQERALRGDADRLEAGRKDDWALHGRDSSSRSSHATGLSNLSTWGSEGRRMHASGRAGDPTWFLRRRWCPQDENSESETAICARTAWMHPSGDTALFPPHGNGPDWEELDAAERKVLGPKNRNYHLYARKDHGLLDPRTRLDTPEDGQSLKSDMGLESTTSTLVLNTRTHRLERRSRNTAPTEKTRGRVHWHDGGDEEEGGGLAKEAGDLGDVLADEKALKQVALLMEAFERSRPNAAGWVFLKDFRWTLHRDLRVQEIFGLERKSTDVLEKKGRRKEEIPAAEAAAQGPLRAVMSWLADTVFRNRDEPVTFTKKSQVKLNAMLDQLRRIESDLISNDRMIDEAKIPFDTFSKAFWPFVGKSLSPSMWRHGVGVYRTVATQKDTPYALTATQMMVRDSLLGVNIAADELRLPDFVELPRLGLMEKPDVSLAHEVGSNRLLQEKTGSLERLRFSEASSPFQQSFADVVRLEKGLAEYQVLKQQLDRVSREAFLSAPSESLARFLAVVRDRAGHVDTAEELAREAGIFRAPPVFMLPSKEHADLREHQRRMRERFGEETSASGLLGVSAIPTALVSDDEDEDEDSQGRKNGLAVGRASPVIPKNLPPLKAAPKVRIVAKSVSKRRAPADDSSESEAQVDYEEEDSQSGGGEASDEEEVQSVRDESDGVSSLSEDE